MEIINYIYANAETIVAIVTGVVTVASLVANLIPGDSENKYIGYAQKAVSWLALNLKKK
jgi:hypothetical protein